VIDNEGLRGYIDVECLQNELTEVTGMTSDEMNQAARQLLTSQTGARSSSTTTESDAASDRPWLTTTARPNRDLYKYEFAV